MARKLGDSCPQGGRVPEEPRIHAGFCWGACGGLLVSDGSTSLFPPWPCSSEITGSCPLVCLPVGPQLECDRGRPVSAHPRAVWVWGRRTVDGAW